MKTIAIILGAGISKRCGFDKIFHGDTIYRSVEVFQSCDQVDEIYVVLNPSQAAHFEALKNTYPKLNQIIMGGEERFDSLKAGIEALQDSEALIVVHNAANPSLDPEELEAGIAQAKQGQNVIFGYFTPNSIKKVQEGKVIQYLDRSEIFETQTPQISTLTTFRKAIEACSHKPKDEAELLSLIGEEVHIYECSRSNKKITYPQDFSQGALLGVGEDAHRFTGHFDPDKTITLGGIEFPECQKTFDANSDGDVIFHSLCNALLSAIGDKTLDDFAGQMCREGIIDSSEYVKETLQRLKTQDAKLKLQQVIISLEGLEPKIAPRHEEIVNNIAQILNIEPLNIGLTYTTGEGFQEGMRCTTYVILHQ